MTIEDLHKAIENDAEAQKETLLIIGRLQDKTATIWLNWIDFGHKHTEEIPMQVPLSILLKGEEDPLKQWLIA